MGHHNCDSDCSWKTAYERLMSKVKDQLDLLEEPVFSGEMSSKTLHKILKKLIQDEQKRTLTKLQSQSSSCSKNKNANSIFKPLTVKKEEMDKNVKHERDSHSDSDSDIEIIDIDKANVENLNLNDEKRENDSKSQTEGRISTKRRLSFENPDEEFHKKIKSTHTQTDTNSDATLEQLQNQSEKVQKEKEEHEEIEQEESPASDSPQTHSENESDEDSFTPIYCPKAAASFWKMSPKSTEKEKAQKLVIHNYPQKLGEENYSDYQSRFGSGLWFLVNNNGSEFTYYKVEELTKKLKSMKKTVPKVWLQLQISDFQNQQLQSFLSEFGKFVTHFTFERRIDDDENEQLTQVQLSSFLFDKLYNVEYLVINEQYISIYSDSDFEKINNKEQQKGQQRKRRELSRLKTIQFINTNYNFSSDFLEPILEFSPNLEFIYNLPLKFVNLIICLGKTHCVKSVEMDHSDSYNCKDSFEQDLETLAESRIALEKLVVPVYFNEPNGDQTVVSINFQQFFESSRKSVKELHIEPTKLADWSKFGRLENLHTLRMNIYGFPPHYSNELNINNVFPKVKTLVLDHWTQKKEKEEKSTVSPQKFFDKYFPHKIFVPGKSFKFVSELKLMNSFPVECMKNLSVLLPRISTFSWTCEFSKFREILALCPSLWAGLKTLTFEIDLGERREDFEYADSSLLGFPENICEELRNGNELENFEQFEKKPSILDLKKLEQFEIEIQEPSCSDEDAETRIFSRISGFHGFAKMKQSNPKFQAQITLHSSCSSKYVQSVKQSLQPLLSFVNH